ncbi:uncharacterized protein LOC132404769 isoform X2 [Hypanus sabinus]|uniref:uncharacterized protein LOC132404769 isoform X2 n=1 Tax=Hypanus sabinus TaxID=79690 RepID=UPI0028C4A8AD|nr:uncharacterized protein LOC132404769 isoform X2 [Hypanus sabinus]
MYLDHTGRGERNFRRLAGIVKTICGMNIALKRYIHKDKVIRWVAHHLTRKSDVDKELLFNIHNFTKSKCERDSAKLKNLLSVLPHERSIHEISLIQTLLHKNQAFQAMPHIVQLEICQAAVYQQYEAKTTVVRKGHQPEACYFVVTGRLIAQSSDGLSRNQNHFSETLNEIEEGDLFGDAALLTNMSRPSTILCRTNAELLLIGKEDFESILAGLLEQRYSVITDLLGSLPIFTSWTAEKLTMLSHSSLLRYYRSGTAVVPESCNSCFIVIVKSGRCYIVTNLIMDQCGKDRAQRPQPKKSAVLLKNLPVLKKDTKSTGKSPLTPDFPSFVTADLQEAIKTAQTRKSRSMEIATPTHPLTEESSYKDLEHKGLEESLPTSASGSERDGGLQQPESLTHTSGKSSACAYVPQDTNNEPEQTEPCKAEHADESSLPEVVIESVENCNETQEATKSLGHNEADEQNKERQKILRNPPQEYPRATFVKVASLEKGGIFGLTEIPGSSFKLQLSLVSDGAECIFVPRKLFLGEAPEKSRQVALELVNTYPNEQVIRENFAREQEWSLYKAKLIRQLLGSRAK